MTFQQTGVVEKRSKTLGYKPNPVSRDKSTKLLSQILKKSLGL